MVRPVTVCCFFVQCLWQVDDLNCFKRAFLHYHMTSQSQKNASSTQSEKINKKEEASTKPNTIITYMNTDTTTGAQLLGDWSALGHRRNLNTLFAWKFEVHEKCKAARVNSIQTVTTCDSDKGKKRSYSTNMYGWTIPLAFLVAFVGLAFVSVQYCYAGRPVCHLKFEQIVYDWPDRYKSNDTDSNRLVKLLNYSLRDCLASFLDPLFCFWNYWLLSNLATFVNFENYKLFSNWIPNDP